ncbi:RusA family crossover junction endodeoxyribonuclease [Aquibium oceanicum]|uniref:Endodeoxyribonuclease RusA n=1 Tax=Aquibium oceanicum TaxID=1670800 RepID=A0A1L3SWU1_9HYPH|nr:RusA family crossover junction endodeoxyribonuclease [Aquibium oceanicum]APH73903.1 endodeoxyribonuclease RusA [Aquibium oceanicum]
MAASLFPFEFIVRETPRSVQASSKSLQRWKERLREAAKRRVEELVEQSWLDQRPLALTIYYFPSAPMDGDVDNIIKPILDALVAVVYPDDRLIERVVAQKFEPALEWSFSQPSEMLEAALMTTDDVVYVRVDDDLAWRRI